MNEGHIYVYVQGWNFAQTQLCCSLVGPVDRLEFNKNITLHITALLGNLKMWICITFSVV